MNNYDFSNSIDKFNEDMKRVLNPMYDIQKTLEPIGDITKTFEPLYKTLDPLVKINEDMERMLNPFKDYYKELDYMLNPMKKWNEEMERMLNPFKDFQNQLGHIYKPTKILNETLQSFKLSKSYLDTIKQTSELQKELTKFSQSYKNIGQVLSTQINQPTNIDKLINEMVIKTEKVDINLLEETIKEKSIIKDNQVSIEDLELLKEDILTNIQFQNMNIEQSIETFRDYVEKQNNPFMVFFYQFFIGILVSIIMTISIQPKLNEVSSLFNDHKTVKKEITKNIKHILPNQSINQFRLVKCDILNVRQGKSTKTKIIGYLTINTLVEIIQKEKNWSLVKHYDSDNDTVIQGWVFTRYLSQIK